MLNMGLNNTKFLSEISSDESEAEDSVAEDSVQDEKSSGINNSFLPEVDKKQDYAGTLDGYMFGYLTVDAAIRKSANFPKPEDVLNPEIVLQLEQQKLDLDEIISLVYLLYDHELRYLAHQELKLRLHNREKIVLHKWAKEQQSMGIKWQKKFIEALCIIKNYKVLRELGYQKQDLIADYMPHNPNFALDLNKLYKGLYLMCENFTNEKTEIFLKHIRQDFIQKSMDFVECDPEYLEIYLLSWENSKYINKTDVTNITRILKIMEEESLYNMFNEIFKGTQTPQINVSNNSPIYNSIELFHTQSIRNELPHNNPTSSKSHTSSTSVDNNNRASSSLSYDRQPPGSYGEDHTKIIHNDTHIEKYPINPKSPGIVLIINQEEFYTEIKEEYKHLLPPNNIRKLDKRNGTEKDRDDLCNIYTKFGFQVVVENNLKHTDMLEKIQDTANLVRHESSFFVCVLSHGDEGIVYGSNSCGVKVRKIESLISRTNKTYLQGKPKVLILQSCQGQYCQKITKEDTSTDEDEENNVTTDSSNKNPLPKTADMFTFWATVPGYAAIRHKTAGSWFIQSLCKNMEILGNRRHFADICTSVVNEVTSKIWDREADDRNVMTPLVVNTFRYPFYLPPLKQ